MVGADESPVPPLDVAVGRLDVVIVMLADADDVTTCCPLVGGGILDEDGLPEFQGGEGPRPAIVVAFGFSLNFGMALCDVLGDHDRGP